MKDYYGWRARIGLIYPSSSTVMEPELYAMAPEGVSIHTARQDIGAIDVEGLTRWTGEATVETCTRQLATASLHSIVLGGTSASFMEGRVWDDDLRRRMTAVSGGIPVTTASTASATALHALGAKRVTFVTAYIDEVNRRGQAFLGEHGFEVLNADGMGITVDPEISAVPGEAVYDFARCHAVAGADALFISCTGLRTVGFIAELEEDLGMPVVTSNQASFWHALRLAGCKARIDGFGRLMALDAPSPGD